MDMSTVFTKKIQQGEKDQVLKKLPIYSALHYVIIGTIA
jgi:hypothetical protein